MIPLAYHVIQSHFDSFVPRDIPGLQLWLDASDVSTVTLDGSNNVSQWADKSGNLKHAAQATTLNRPTWLTNQLNGFGAVRPNGANQWLEVPSMPAVDAGWTILIVTRRGNASAVGIIGANAGTINSAFVIGPAVGNNLQVSQWGSAVNVAGPAVGSGIDYGILATYDGSHPTGNFSIRVSTNATPATGAMTQLASTPPATTWNIGRYGTPGGYYGSGLYEIVAYNRKITSGEELQLRSYITGKWGVVWS